MAGYGSNTVKLGGHPQDLVSTKYRFVLRKILGKMFET